MNPARIAILLAALVLAGCATQTRERAEASKRKGFTAVQERPGLGTSWGEQRESWVEPAPFARTSAEHPSGQARIYYNDREGANAMLAFLGGPARPCDGWQPSAGGLLRLGLRTGNGTWAECRESHGRRIATGDHGARYEVMLKNDARHAVEVVVSVDGLDAMDGKPASFRKRGYVLAPFETLAVEVSARAPRRSPHFTSARCPAATGSAGTGTRRTQASSVSQSSRKNAAIPPPMIPPLATTPGVQKHRVRKAPGMIFPRHRRREPLTEAG